MEKETNNREVIFNEQTLKAEIAKTWGEHGAHMEVYNRLLGNREVKEVTAEEILKSKLRHVVTMTDFNKILEAMQEFANNQVAEKEREIEKLRKNYEVACDNEKYYRERLNEKHGENLKAQIEYRDNRRKLESKLSEMTKALEENEWISVKNYLPELYKDVLIISGYGNILIAQMGGEEERFFNARSSEQPYIEEVAFWMPLPKKP